MKEPGAFYASPGEEGPGWDGDPPDFRIRRNPSTERTGSTGRSENDKEKKG